MKSKALILICILAAFATVECGVLKKLFHHETPSTTTVAPQPSIFFNNNLPKIEKGCTATYNCARKKAVLPQATTKACLQYCLKHTTCGNSPAVNGKDNECVELNEEMVRKEHEQNSILEQVGSSPSVSVMRVAMIDFPCQPGYLPDSRGRCREVW